MSQLTTISEVGRIAKLSDPVVRNFQITKSYHEISLVMSKRLGPVANWCTFATWASRQAGQTIRGEDLSNALQEKLDSIPALSQTVFEIIKGVELKGSRIGKKGISKMIWETVDPKAAMKRAGDAVARGNQKVFAEIAHEFARYIETCLNDKVFDAGKIKIFCSAMKPGDPPAGQKYLQDAFLCYYKAQFENDEKKKAELIFLANLECGFHEQTRLQPEISEAMEASVIDADQFKEKLLSTHFPNQSWLSNLGSMFTRIFRRPTPLDISLEKFVKETRHHIRIFLTAHMMELGFPDAVHIHLGKDLKANFPPHLKKLFIPELIAFLKKIDPTPDSLLETGAIDWANLDDRLHFICDLFRCYQETTELLSSP